MIRFACPVCGKVYKAQSGQAGRRTECKKCGALVAIPERPVREIHYGIALPPPEGVGVVEDAPADSPAPAAPDSPPAESVGGGDRSNEDRPTAQPSGERADEATGNRGRHPPEKFCHECGEPIRKAAVICPECGVRQFGRASRLDDSDETGSRERRRDNAVHGTRIAAGVLGLLLGGFGIHKFILGYVPAGLLMLLVSVLSFPLVFVLGTFTCGLGFCFLPGVYAMSVVGMVEGVLYLTKSNREFRRTYVERQRPWF